MHAVLELQKVKNGTLNNAQTITTALNSAAALHLPGSNRISAADRVGSAKTVLAECFGEKPGGELTKAMELLTGFTQPRSLAQWYTREVGIGNELFTIEADGSVVPKRDLAPRADMDNQPLQLIINKYNKHPNELYRNAAAQACRFMNTNTEARKETRKRAAPDSDHDNIKRATESPSAAPEQRAAFDTISYYKCICPSPPEAAP
jgi:hypothetical protein